MSFTEGFRTGFGLVNQVQDRQLQRDRLEEQARQRDLDRQATSDYRADQTRISVERNEIAKTDAESQAEYRQGQLDNQEEATKVAGADAENKRTQLGIAKVKADADAGLSNARAKTLEDSLKVKQKRRGQRETNAQAALQVQAFVDLAEQVRSGDVAYDEDTKARLATMAESTRGSLMDLDYITQPNVQFQAGRLQQTLNLISEGKADQINETALRDTFNVVFHSNNMAGVGEVVTSETHKNAGDYADKGFVVVGKQISKVALDGNSLGLTVDVLIENPETGETFTYEAPMTIGREASSEKAFMSVEEAVQAAGGFFQYANSMAPYRGVLNEINARGYDLTEGRKDGDFLQLVANDINAAELDGKRNPDLSSPIKGMTMEQFAADKGLMRSHYSANRVGNYQPVEAAMAGDATYNLLSSAPLITNLERYNENKPIPRAKVLEAAQYISPKEDKNGNITFHIDDEKKWDEWRNKSFRRTSQSNRNPSGRVSRQSYENLTE